MQIQCMLYVAVYVDLEAAPKRINKRHRLRHLVIARDEIVAVVLPGEARRGAIVLEQVIDAQNDHRPDPFARSQVHITLAAIRTHRRTTHAWPFHGKSAWLHKE